MTQSFSKPFFKGIWILIATFCVAAFAYFGIIYSLTSAAPEACGFPATVTSEAEELNEAITCYGDESAPGTYMITITQNISLTASTTSISNTIAGVELEINGEGFIVDGQNTDDVRPFKVMTDTVVWMNDLTVTRGRIATGGANANNGGAGIQNFGVMTINE